MQFGISEAYHRAGLPFRARVLEHVCIPMADGAALSARIWLPEGADDAAIPAVVEYRPYRRRDVTAFPDSLTHGYLAVHSYACVRVDMVAQGIPTGAGHHDGDPLRQ